MLSIYYKIWVSLFIKVSNEHGETKASIILCLVALTGVNIMNYFLVCFVFITLFKVNLNFLHYFYLHNPYLTIAIAPLIIFLLNYFLLVFNNKHEYLLNLYRNQNSKNLARNYYILSFVIITLYLFATVCFPGFFGLRDTNN
jgi:hypothetical protein